MYLKEVLSLFVILVLFSLSSCSGSTEKTPFEIERDQKKEIIRRQEEFIKKQEREEEDLERQKFWNNELKRYE